MVAATVFAALLSLLLGLFPNGIFHFHRLAYEVAISVMEGAGR